MELDLKMMERRRNETESEVHSFWLGKERAVVCNGAYTRGRGLLFWRFGGGHSYNQRQMNTCAVTSLPVPVPGPVPGPGPVAHARLGVVTCRLHAIVSRTAL